MSIRRISGQQDTSHVALRPDNQQASYVGLKLQKAGRTFLLRLIAQHGLAGATRVLRALADELDGLAIGDRGQDSDQWSHRTRKHRMNTQTGEVTTAVQKARETRKRLCQLGATEVGEVALLAAAVFYLHERLERLERLAARDQWRPGKQG
jgi:hypothetical protein